MVIVEFLGPIKKDSLQLEINNLKELAILLQKTPSMQEWLENSAVAVNDTLVANLNFPLKDGDKVSMLPPVCGG